MNSPLPDDSLAQTLRDWRVTPPRDPGFRAAVRERIEAGAPVLSWGAFVRRHAAMCAGVVAVAVVIGALAGRDQARTRVASSSRQLAASYVHALDARNMQMP
jgi:hypothetical protein